jgi:hypothetical protein
MYDCATDVGGMRTWLGCEAPTTWRIMLLPSGRSTMAVGSTWQRFEEFLLRRHPDATRIYTDDAEPSDNEVDNRDFLHSLGYQQLVGSHLVFAKELPDLRPN